MTPTWCCDMTLAALPGALPVVVDYHIVNSCHFDLGHIVLMVSVRAVLLMLWQADVARTILQAVLESVAFRLEIARL